MVLADPSLVAWAVTPDLRVSFVCDRAAAALGQTTPDHVLERPLDQIVPEPVVERMDRLVGRAMSERAHIVGAAVWRGRRMRSSFLPRRDTNGGMGEVLVVTRPAPLALEEPDGVAVDEAPYVDLGPFHHLTRRELEVLAYLGRGLTLGEIAETLHRSVKTIKRFREELAKKLGEGDRCRLAQIARDAGLMPHHAELQRIRWSPPTLPGTPAERNGDAVG